jgi:hypothetical protein
MLPGWHISVADARGTDAYHASPDPSDHALRNFVGLRYRVCLFALLGLRLTVAVLSYISNETISMLFTSIG